MNIPVSKLHELVNNIPALDALVVATTNKIDDAVLASAKTALAALAKNLGLINAAADYLNLPVSFTSTQNHGGQVSDDAMIPMELMGIPGLADLRAIVLTCDCNGGECGS